MQNNIRMDTYAFCTTFLIFRKKSFKYFPTLSAYISLPENNTLRMSSSWS